VPPPWGQLRRQHLDGDDALEGQVEGLEHNPHAAAAHDFLDLVVPQPTEVRGIGRRIEEIEGQLGRRGESVRAAWRFLAAVHDTL
jgi:hypothetical protein